MKILVVNMMPGIWIFLLLLFPGCGRYKHVPTVLAPAVSTTPGSSAQPFASPEGQSIGFSSEGIKKHHEYTLEKISFPTSLETTERNRIVEMFLYTPQAPLQERDALVVLLPILGGKGYFSIYFARQLVREGFYVLRFTRKKDFLSAGRGILFEKKLIRSYVMDVARGIDYVHGRPGFENKKMGIAGISMGGMIAPLVMARVPYIRAGVFMLSGGDWATVYTKSMDPYVSRYRKKILKKMSVAKLTGIMEKNFSSVSPVYFAKDIPADRVLMIEGLFDRVIPAESINRFWEALGRPDRLSIPTGHYTSAVFLPWISSRLYKFFEKKLR